MKAGTLTACATAIVLGCMAVGPAQAATDCTMTTAAVNFGAYDPLNATPDDATATLRVSCSNSPPPGSASISYVVRLSSGLAGTFSPRKMGAGAARLNYFLYRNSARTQVWGDGTAGSQVVTGTFSLNGNQTRNRNHRVYGRIPAAQDPTPGSYTDTIIVTLEF